MIATKPDKPICFPPAPLNGGPLDSAPAKVGAWVWQPKVDDWRAVIHTPTRTVWNQYGQPSSIAGKFEPALDHLARVSFAAEWLDVGMMENRNDMMRGSIIVLDLIERGLTHDERRMRLALMFTELPWASELVATHYANQSVFLIPQWPNAPHAGLCLYQACKDQNARLGGRKFYEGVVAKRADSPYPFGQRPKQQVATWIKHRFDQ